MGAAIAVVSSTRGVGKTSLALNIAFSEHAFRSGSALLVDAAPQQTLMHWAAAAVPGVDVEQITRHEEILDRIPQWQERYSLTVIDTGDGDTPSVRAAIYAADLAVILCGPTLPDLEAATHTQKLVELANHARGMGLPQSQLAPFRWNKTNLASDVITKLEHCARQRSVVRDVLPPVPQRDGLEDYPNAGDVIWRSSRNRLTSTMKAVAGRIAANARTCAEWRLPSPVSPWEKAVEVVFDVEAGHRFAEQAGLDF